MNELEQTLKDFSELWKNQLAGIDQQIDELNKNLRACEESMKTITNLLTK